MCRCAYLSEYEGKVFVAADYDFIFKKKGNTAATVKEQETAWQKMYIQVNM